MAMNLLDHDHKGVAFFRKMPSGAKTGAETLSDQSKLTNPPCELV